jgi:hypothetical protein
MSGLHAAADDRAQLGLAAFGMVWQNAVGPEISPPLA